MKMLEEESDGLYIQDIIRRDIRNDAPLIPITISQKSLSTTPLCQITYQFRILLIF